MFSPTQDQTRALEYIEAWYQDNDRPYLTLGGYAGTGKTSLIAEYRRLLEREEKGSAVAFCAFTGKAAQVLNSKLRAAETLSDHDSVSTIHSLIYEPVIDEEEKLLEWKRRSTLDCDLIVLDEASMVSQELWKDLLSYGIPILAVGDHGQLPPVNDKFSLMAEPDIKLEQIHRQAEGHPIIQLSLQVRETGRIPYGSPGPGVNKIRNRFNDVEMILKSWDSETLVLAGRNTTRIHLNRQIRRHRGLTGEEPVEGDRVICLKNNWNKFLYNGLMGKLDEITVATEPGTGRSHWYKAKISFDDDSVFRGLISKHQFHQPKTLFEIPGLRPSEFGELFDFGYALTVHKAQGSQAKRVIVFEERFSREEDLWRRWLYTAVTRAEEELVVVG